MRRRIGKCLRFFHIGAEQCGHRALADRDSGLHRPTAQFEQPGSIRQRESARGAERGIFAEAVTRDEISLFCKRDAALAFEHAKDGYGVGHDRRLRVFGEHQLVLGPFAHYAAKVLAQRLVHLFEDLARSGACVGKVCAHAHFLAALSRKYESAHPHLPARKVPALCAPPPHRKGQPRLISTVTPLPKSPALPRTCS